MKLQCYVTKYSALMKRVASFCFEYCQSFRIAPYTYVTMRVDGNGMQEIDKNNLPLSQFASSNKCPNNRSGALTYHTVSSTIRSYRINRICQMDPRKKGRSCRDSCNAGSLCRLNSPFIILTTRSTPSTRHFLHENGEESTD